MNNQLTTWPVEMAQLKIETYWKWQLRKGFYLEGNPLENPPPEIIQQGQTTLLEYFKAGEQQRLNEVKVLLVGDGGAGKTSLVKQLLGEKFNPHESQTKGINIKQWEVVDISHLETTTEDEQKIKAHLWDFGGQEIMHATHQFFLSKRSLYILVLDGRKEENPEYWLKYIESFGGDSPILVVLNKLDQHSAFEVNQKDLRNKYPGIQGFYRLSCETQEGIPEFRMAFQQALHKIEIRRMFLPITWFEIKTQLEQMAEPYIDYTQYTNICASANIIDKSTQQILINYLCHLGTILHFQESQLKYTHVLEPKWVTQAIYKIINARRVTDNKGILEFDDLETILEPEDDHDYVYPGEQHTYIVGLMKKFELCYPLDEQRVLIPDLLPVEEPDFSFDQLQTLQVQLHYNFLPKSVMPRFIVRRHRDIKENLRWRTGVVLSDKDFQATAVVKSDNEARKIYIEVSGPQRRDYFAIVRKTFKDINNSFEKLEVDERVCLPKNPDITISLEHLYRLEKMGQTTYIPEGANKPYNIRELLGTVITENHREEEILDYVKKTHDHVEKIHTKTEETSLQKTTGSLLLQPNIFGIGLNLNNLFNWLLGRTKKPK
ncbi:leucine-rich-repeat protein [Beggiatoa sp. PS]|nr:leucine-rich-repeat protein [Beggiatoa sp. PS]